jgi:RNA polymerase sigma factor (sigma-70 family)
MGHAVAALCRELTIDRRTDGELLAAFTSGDSEAAFSELIRRHGPLVWGACRRLLPNPADAEDAFQAAFLVLVRRARRLTRSPAVGPWLHRVAVWTARNVRRKNARRLARQEPLPDHVTDPVAPPDPDLKADLDAALLALPSCYRESIILCHLQGFSRREAAERLGCAEGTLSAWLHRGLAKLRARLRAFEPLTLPALTLAVPPALAASTAHAAVATAVAGAAVPPAVHSLVEGVLHMFWVKKATATTVALFATFALGVGLGVGSRTEYSAATAGEGPGEKVLVPAPQQTDETKAKLQEELARLSRLLARAERKLDVAKQAAKLVGKNLQRATDLGDQRAAAEGREALARAERDCAAAAKECERLRDQIRAVEAKLKAIEIEKAAKPQGPATPPELANRIKALEEQVAAAEAAHKSALEGVEAAKNQIEVAKKQPDGPRALRDGQRALAQFQSLAEETAASLQLLKRQLAALKGIKADEKPAKPRAAADEIEKKLRELQAQAALMQAEREKLDALRKEADAKAEEIELKVQRLREEAQALRAKRAELDRKVEAVRSGGYLELKVYGKDAWFEYSLSETGADGKPVGTAIVREPAMLQKLLARARADPTAPKELRLVAEPNAKSGSYLLVSVLKACDAAGYRSIKFTGYIFAGGLMLELKPDQKGEAPGYKHYQAAEKNPSELIKEIELGMSRY